MKIISHTCHIYVASINIILIHFIYVLVTKIGYKMYYNVCVERIITKLREIVY